MTTEKQQAENLGSPSGSTAVVNTDKEIWRREPGDFYSASIHVTLDGLIGMNVGGRVHVMSIEAWHNLAGGQHQVSPLD